jgi:hypothetical protein
LSKKDLNEKARAIAIAPPVAVLQKIKSVGAQGL